MTNKELEKKKKESTYDASSITVLEGLEPVRKRPGMYIGSTSASGLHHLIWEVVDNSIDEAMAGFCNYINVTLLADGTVEVIDNGRGIPVEKHKATGVSALETVLTKLHAGGKFGDGGYKVSGGLHGVGVSVVNALSEYMKAEVHRDGKAWVQEYHRGKPKSAAKPVGKAVGTGTIITFKPDATIFTELEFDWEKILTRLRQQAYLTKGITIEVNDKRTKGGEKKYKFHFEGGIKAYTKALNRNNTVKHENIFYVDKEFEGSRVEIALQYNDEFNESVLPFANNIYNSEGGTHVIGFKTSLTRTLNAYARNHNLIKEKDENLTGDDVREGLTAIISVKLKDPQFEGQTKAKLGNAEIKTAVEQVFGAAFADFLEEHPKDAEAIIGKCVLSAMARMAARTARASILRKGALEGMTLPGKLADCSSNSPEECELYIVEGDSAGGCFSGDTEVALVDGRHLSFRQLIKENRQGKNNFCYTIRNDGEIGIAPIINPRLTKKGAEVVKIILDNKEEITCTADHKFMLRDGSYKEAKCLTADDSLMPLYRQYSKIGQRIIIEGYEMVLNPATSRWVFTHLLADRHNIDNGFYSETSGIYRHHADFNKLNNSPENIIRLSKEEHLKIHRDMAAKTLFRPDVLKKLAKIRKSPAYRQKISKTMSAPAMAELLSRRAKKQWLDENLRAWRKKETKKQWTLEFRNKRKETYNQTYLRKALSVLYKIYQESKSITGEKYEQIRKSIKDKSIIKYETICERFFAGEEKLLKEAAINFNHRIRAVVPLKEKFAVYDLEVPETHNFALASGIFVHNSAKQGRDRKFQAILPLRGKILNVERARLDKMLANNEIKNMVIAFGTNIDEQLDMAKLRYHRIIIMTDADVDGAHIRTLLLTLFYRHFEPLITNGHVYIAQPPLYQIKKGSQIEYAYSDEEKIAIIKKLGGNVEEVEEIAEGDDFSAETEEGKEKKSAKLRIQRYKGLGEMNPEQLWETTMDPARRILKQVTLDDAQAADEIFDMLMGDDVAPRKHFIQTHAKKVKNLDI